MSSKFEKWLNKEYSFTTAFVYLLSFTLLFILFTFIGKISLTNFTSSLLQWDANWYHSIVTEGYSFQEKVQSNSGFFPGFPYLWKILHLSPLGISIINFLIFLVSFSWLASYLKATNLKALLILTLPSIFFFYVPYSESLFYGLTIWAIINWKKEKWKWVFISFVLLSLVRPSVFFLIPAISALLLFNHKKLHFLQILLLLSALILGTLLGFYIIGNATGNIFAYSESQSNNWNHLFSLPSFPLTTWRGYRILWLDAWAFYSALIIAFYSLIWGISYFQKKIKHINDEILFISFIYISMILLYVLFFHLKEDNSTSILSMNRYLFCNPFLHYILFKHLFNVEVNQKNIRILSAILVITLIVFGFPYSNVVELNYIQSMFFFAGFIGFILLQTIPLLKRKYTILYLLILATNIILQLYLFQGYLKGNWIG